MRNDVQHAACGGGDIFASSGEIRCSKCGHRIIDARELTPRPKPVIERPQSTGDAFRAFMTRKSDHNDSAFSPLQQF